MEGAPKFIPVSEGPNGNNLERVKADSPEAVPGELSEAERDDLRDALRALGVGVKKND